jgi:L-malate glycosyltransferase
MNDRLRIGIVCYPKAGGSGIVATELGTALATRGHEVHFISSARPFRLTEHQDRVHVHQVETADYPLFDYPPYTLALAVKMHQVSHFHDLDLYHVHYAIPHAASAILARDMCKRCIPVVTTLHGTDITLVGKHPSYHRITRYCIESSDAVTSVSDWLTGETRRIFETDKDIETLPNFVNTELFKPGVDLNLRRRFAQDDELLLLHASNFRPVKRAPFLLDVFARLKKRDRCVLVLAGDGPELVSMEHRVRDMGLENRVKFLGAWDDMETLLPLADLLMIPSEYESFGLAPLEAMSCGVPVLVTQSGGPPEVLKPGMGGELLDPHDLEAWVVAADRLLEDEKLRKEQGAAGRRRAMEHFARDRIVDRYELLFRSVMEKNEAKKEKS